MSGRGFGKRYFHDRNDFGGFRGRGGRGGDRGGRGGRGRGFFGGPYPNFRGNDYQNEGNFGGYRNRPPNNFNRNQPFNRPKRDTPGKRLSEAQIGVTEYVSEHDGFSAIIKSRYSDFQVSEINLKGEVAKLTDQSLPETADETVSEDEDLLINKYNLEILPMETWDKINALVVSKTEMEPVEIDVTGMSKEERTKIHEAVKKAFGKRVVGSTCQKDDKKVVQFKKFKKGERYDNRVKWVWPGEYVHFIVYKENLDTMEVASQLAEKLRLNIKPSMLGYAGTKDRRAKTTQWFSLRKVDPMKIHMAGRSLRDVYIGNYEFSDANIQLGRLKGNRFRIALRNVTVPDDVVNNACELLKTRGFINYYGLQRFGTRVETPTYVIGKKLLQMNLKGAIDSIMEERPCSYEYALKIYKQEGIDAALRVWGRNDRGAVEFRMLRALQARGKDLMGAIGKLPRNTFLLYLHSYQSLVWNSAVSERLRRFGLKPAVGDLVALVDVDIEDDIRVEELATEAEDETETDSEQEQQDGDDKTAQNGAQADSKVTDDKNTTQKEIKKIPVKVLTQDDIDSGKYSVNDIVMPLPGFSVEYPPNMKDYYEEFVTKDELKLDLKNKNKNYSLSGTYRRMVVVPGECSWEIVKYSDPFADLILSDRDELINRTATGILEGGKYKALLLTMSLPASCYATMALRELLRIDTSSDTQAALNDYHMKDKNKNKKKKTSESETPKTSEETNDETNNKASEESEGNQENAEKRKLDGDDNVDAKKLKPDQ